MSGVNIDIWWSPLESRQSVSNNYGNLFRFILSVSQPETRDSPGQEIEQLQHSDNLMRTVSLLNWLNCTLGNWEKNEKTNIWFKCQYYLTNNHLKRLLIILRSFLGQILILCCPLYFSPFSLSLSLSDKWWRKTTTGQVGRRRRRKTNQEENEGIFRKERLIHFWTENISNRHLRSSSVDLIYVNFSVYVATLKFCLVKSQKRQKYKIFTIAGHCYNYDSDRPCSWAPGYRVNKVIFIKALIRVLK